MENSSTLMRKLSMRDRLFRMQYRDFCHQSGDQTDLVVLRNFTLTHGLPSQVKINQFVTLKFENAFYIYYQEKK